MEAGGEKSPTQGEKPTTAKPITALDAHKNRLRQRRASIQSEME
jgi:hypothetical protein